jgi:hypothetical protein
VSTTNQQRAAAFTLVVSSSLVTLLLVVGSREHRDLSDSATALVTILSYGEPTLTCLLLVPFMRKRDFRTIGSSVSVVAWALVPYVVGITAYFLVSHGDPIEAVVFIAFVSGLNLAVGSSVLILASRLRRHPRDEPPPRPDIGQERFPNRS